jgi:hypothetical protein
VTSSRAKRVGPCVLLTFLTMVERKNDDDRVSAGTGEETLKPARQRGNGSDVEKEETPQTGKEYSAVR